MKKFAICLHGLVGNIKGKSSESNIGEDVVLNLAFNHWNKYFIEPYHPDIFIHSWNTNLETEIKNLFQPIDSVIEPQIIFDVSPEKVPGKAPRVQAHFSKWYSNKKSVELMLQYARQQQFIYDVVMIARFDIAWKKTINPEELQPNTFYYGGWQLRSPRNKLKDLFFVGTQKQIFRFSTIYDKIEEYCFQHGIISKKNGISNHKLAAFHLSQMNVKAEPILMCSHDTDAEQSDYPLVRYLYFQAPK